MIFKTLDLSEALKERLLQSQAILHEDAEVKEIFGETQVEGILLKDGTRIEVSGVFIELGARGVMDLATRLGIRLDDTMRFIETDKKMETNLTGVFAAGDVCGPPWQMAKAVGEGCVAGISAAEYVKGLDSSGLRK
jgi:thioredoxin reductase (NADPH)